jgi:hypothetical protein
MKSWEWDVQGVSLGIDVNEEGEEGLVKGSSKELDRGHKRLLAVVMKRFSELS